MSAVSRLWRRAPLWRLCVTGAVVFSAVTVIWPAPWMVRLCPPFAALTHKVDHLLHRSSPSSSAPEQDAGTGAPSEAGPAPADGGNDIAATPSIETELRDLLPFAGRKLPLPAGVWHPVLTTQEGPHGELISNVLVRTDRGVVTGVIIARGTTASVPAEGAGQLDEPCHDDRNFMRQSLPSPAHSSQCIATSASVTSTDAVSSSAAINWAFKRLHVLGFPMPPLLVTAIWSHIVAAPDGGINFETVEYAFSPAQPGTAHLATSLDDWTKEGLGHSPFSSRFVDAVNSWITGWAPVLMNGYNGNLSPFSGNRPGSEDPAWHGQ